MLPFLAWLLFFSAPPQDAGQPRLTVSAAVSLTEAIEEIARAYTAAGHGRVVLNFAASNVLARQIANGAPVDVFISADGAQMAVVEKAGLTAPGSIVQLLGNKLAIVVRKDRAGALPSAASLASSDVRRVAIGDPDAVPAGIYAKQYLERIGLWTALQHKMVPSASVRAALAAVQHGGADAGIVYVTDARVSAAVRVAAVIDGPEAPEIVYPAAVISTSARKDPARAFLEFLRTAEAGRVFRKFGFEPRAQGQ
jgi:molybdate transport system substrate-binding protein